MAAAPDVIVVPRFKEPTLAAMCMEKKRREDKSEGKSERQNKCYGTQ